ncbi:MAG: VOC family protein [Chitinophagaceae bacterium]|nr:VOC family protein [Chitinophagaceae bacterium]
MMKRVTGIGGIFFKCEDTAKQKSWYQNHLGMEMNDWGGAIFWWRDNDQPEKKCSTSWSTFKNDTNYFDPSKKPFMFNYRVENLEALLKVLKEEGVEQVGEIEVYEYGKFGWIMDPEGNKIELWEPVDEKL